MTQPARPQPAIDWRWLESELIDYLRNDGHNLSLDSINTSGDKILWISDKVGQLDKVNITSLAQALAIHISERKS